MSLPKFRVISPERAAELQGTPAAPTPSDTLPELDYDEWVKQGSDPTRFCRAPSDTPEPPDDPFCINCGAVKSYHFTEKLGLKCPATKSTFFAPKPAPTASVPAEELMRDYEELVENAVEDIENYLSDEPERCDDDTVGGPSTPHKASLRFVMRELARLTANADANAIQGKCSVCKATVVCSMQLNGELHFYDDDGGDPVPHQCAAASPDRAEPHDYGTHQINGEMKEKKWPE